MFLQREVRTRFFLVLLPFFAPVDSAPVIDIWGFKTEPYAAGAEGITWSQKRLSASEIRDAVSAHNGAIYFQFKNEESSNQSGSQNFFMTKTVEFCQNWTIVDLHFAVRYVIGVTAPNASTKQRQFRVIFIITKGRCQ